jgi:L-asparagine transporter-like permease
LRLAQRRERRPEPAVRIWAFPWLSYATVAGLIAVLVAMALTPDLASQLYVSLVALAVAVLAYLLLRRQRMAAKSRGNLELTSKSSGKTGKPPPSRSLRWRC